MATTCRLPAVRERDSPCPLRNIYRVEPLLAAFLLLGLLPLMLVLAGVIATLSRRLPLIRHGRVGFGGAPLRMMKFRTMWPEHPRSGYRKGGESLPRDKRLPDPRVTSRFAAWCRRHSLDELPQLIHVLRGEMSLVGPRPVTKAELSGIYGCHATEILAVRPGLSGLWQVLGRNDLCDERRRSLDLFFAQAATPRLYMAILFLSIPAVLSGKGAY